MTTSSAPLPDPPSDTRLIPITSFRAFHGNYTGIATTGEMKLSIIIPVDDIPAAMKIATAARKEVLWVEVHRMEMGGEKVRELGEVIAAQEKARKKARGESEGEGEGGDEPSAPHPELGFSDE